MKTIFYIVGIYAAWSVLSKAAAQQSSAASGGSGSPALNLQNIENMMANMTAGELQALASQLQHQGLPAITSGSSQVMQGLG